MRMMNSVRARPGGACPTTSRCVVMYTFVPAMDALTAVNSERRWLAEAHMRRRGWRRLRTGTPSIQPSIYRICRKPQQRRLLREFVSEPLGIRMHAARLSAGVSNQSSLSVCTSNARPGDFAKSQVPTHLRLRDSSPGTWRSIAWTDGARTCGHSPNGVPRPTPH